MKGFDFPFRKISAQRRFVEETFSVAVFLVIAGFNRGTFSRAIVYIFCRIDPGIQPAAITKNPSNFSENPCGLGLGEVMETEVRDHYFGFAILKRKSAAKVE